MSIHRPSLKSLWAAFALLLIVTNLITYSIARRGGDGLRVETTSGVTGKYRAGLNRHEQEQHDRASRRLTPNQLTRSRLSEARSLFHQPERSDAPPEISVLSSSGRLTTGAAEAADLTPEERIKVQSVFDAAFSEAEADFTTRAVLDESKTDPEAGVYTFEVPAAADRGAGILLKLHQDLRDLLGVDRADLLCKSYDPTQFRGGFGQSDMEFVIHTPDSKVGAGSSIIHYRLTNPEGRNVNTTAMMNLEAFTDAFGKVFTIQQDD